MATLNVLKAEAGDLTIAWDPTNEAEVNLARKAFADAKANGYFAYTVSVDDAGEPDRTAIKEFDPNATKIVMTPQLVGG